jgi:DNA-binding PadR family transcriptional regulator
MTHTLGDVEQLAAFALLQLRQDAYGVAVQREIAHRAGREVALGAVYATLTRLEEKGLVVAGGTADPGPRRPAEKAYLVLPAGKLALREALAALRASEPRPHAAAGFVMTRLGPTDYRAPPRLARFLLGLRYRAKSASSSLETRRRLRGGAAE